MKRIIPPTRGAIQTERRGGFVAPPNAVRRTPDGRYAGGTSTRGWSDALKEVGVAVPKRVTKMEGDLRG